MDKRKVEEKLGVVNQDKLDKNCIKPVSGNRSIKIYQYTKYIFLALSAIILVYFLFYFIYYIWGRSNKVKEDNTLPYCKITKNNLCDNKYIELTGVLKSAQLTSGVGYLFEPEDKSIINPVYIQGIKFNARRASSGEYSIYENVFHKMPFGQKVLIRGRVVVRDAYRCSQISYASSNPTICKPGGFRVLVFPDVIFSIPDDSGQNISFSIFGKIKNIKSAKASCSENLELCEGLTEGKCYKIQPTDYFCDSLDSDPNMYLVTGYNQDIKTPLKIYDAYHVNGMDYTNTPDNSALNNVVNSLNTVLTTKNAGTVSIYSKIGTEITSFDSGNTGYYDLQKVFPMSNEAYYFSGNKFYKKQYTTESTPEFIGSLDNKLFDERTTLYGFKRSDDGKVLYFVTSRMISERIKNDYSISTNIFKIYKLDFNNLIIEDGVLQADVIYSEELEGFLNLEGFDFKQNKLLLSKSFNEDNSKPCKLKIYYQADLLTNNVINITSTVESGTKYCGEIISKKKYVSDDGHYLVLAEDFNISTTSPKASKLLVYDIYGDTVKSQVFLAERGLIDSEEIQIINIDQSKIILAMPQSKDVLYYLNRQGSDYSLSYIYPLNPGDNKSLKEEVSQNPQTFLGQTNYIYDDDEGYYFFPRHGAEKQLYILKHNTNELFLAGTFSYMAKEIIINNELYIIDFY